MKNGIDKKEIEEIKKMIDMALEARKSSYAPY